MICLTRLSPLFFSSRQVGFVNRLALGRPGDEKKGGGRKVVLNDVKAPKSIFPLLQQLN